MENLHQITLKNPKIISFFEKNKNYDPEIMFLCFLEFLENMNINLNEKINTTINNQILSGVLELKNQNNIIYDNLNKINTEIVKNSFYVSYSFLITTGTICLIEALRTDDAKIRHIMNVETCISVIAGIFYAKFIDMIKDKDIDYNRIINPWTIY